MLRDNAPAELTPRAAELRRQLPVFPWGWSSGQARTVDAAHRFHLFTDVALKPTLTSRYGDAAVGAVLIDSSGNQLGKWGTPVGKKTNNQAELRAISVGLAHAARTVHKASEAVVVCHTDSKLAYHALRSNEVNKEELLTLALKVHDEGRKFHAYYFEKRPSACAGIRAAETAARSALYTHLKLPKKRRRGSKGGAPIEKPWNPFEGEGGW